MYITAKELIKQYGVRYTDAEDMTLEDVKNALSEKAEEYGLAVSFLNEEVTYGLFGGKKDCLVLMHPTFKMEYYMYAIMLAPQGKTCVVEVYTFGRSAQMSKEEFANNTRVFTGENARGAAVGLLRGGAVGVGFAAGSIAAGVGKAGIKALAKGINALTRNQQALEEEKGWYDLLNAILDEVIC
ncbi:MAG: hypothetical protein IKU72_01150 [Oscillospiraceae bacterium]|nr:hypothetical protein [Oscillospiraceae bacterium]